MLPSTQLLTFGCGFSILEYVPILCQILPRLEVPGLTRGSMRLDYSQGVEL